MPANERKYCAGFCVWIGGGMTMVVLPLILSTDRFFIKGKRLHNNESITFRQVRITIIFKTKSANVMPGKILLTQVTSFFRKYCITSNLCIAKPNEHKCTHSNKYLTTLSY